MGVYGARWNRSQPEIGVFHNNVRGDRCGEWMVWWIWGSKIRDSCMSDVGGNKERLHLKRRRRWYRRKRVVGRPNQSRRPNGQRHDSNRDEKKNGFISLFKKERYVLDAQKNITVLIVKTISGQNQQY